MVPARKSNRKCVQLAAQMKKSKGAVKASINEDAGSVVVTSPTCPIKRKRTNSDKEPKADAAVPVREVIADKIAEIKKIIDSIETLEELTETQLQLLETRKYVAAKVQEKRVYLEELQAKDEQQLAICKSKKAVHPLLIDVILKKLASFTSEDDIPPCRLVSTKWNNIFAAQLKKICWTSLTFAESGIGSTSCTKEFRLDEFLDKLQTNSPLFPLVKFSISLYVIPPGITKFFSIYSNHIKILELKFHIPKELSGTVAGLNAEGPNLDDVLRGLEKFLLPTLTNCEELYLTAFPCELLTNTTSVVESKKMKLKKLEVEMICHCSTSDHPNYNLQHSLTSNTFLTKLILANPTLESFDMDIDSKPQFGSLNLDQVYNMLLSYANITNLKHLGLKSENVTRWNWFEQQQLTQPQPQQFQLKSLELKNIVIAPLKMILDHHAKTLEKLCIEIDSSRVNEGHQHQPGAGVGDPVLFSISPLPQKFKLLRELSLEITEGQEDNISALLFANLYPNLEKLKLTNVNENFVRAYARRMRTQQRANNHGGGGGGVDMEDQDNDVDDADGSGSDNDENHLEITTLEIEIDDSDRPTDNHFLRHTFDLVQHLVITTNQSRFITPIWTCGFNLKSLDLRVIYEGEDNVQNDEYYIQHLDTIISGFSVNDCEKIYQYIMHEFHSTAAGFQLGTFNTDWFETICKNKDYPSIRNLTTLQRLSVTCSRNSSRLTEVTLVTVLLYLKSLTALTISNCSISQNFVSKIKEQMYPGFYLNIDGVKRS